MTPKLEPQSAFLSTRKSVGLGCLLAALLAGCGRENIPFIDTGYKDVGGGRMMSNEEVAYYDRLKALNISTKTNPKDPVAFNELGEMFKDKGNFDLAKDLFVKATEKDPTLYQPYLSLGEICIREKNFTDAEVHLGKARERMPDDAHIYYRMGQAKAGLGKNNEAAQLYNEAVARDPELTYAYLDWAKLYYLQRRYKEAEDLCRRGIKYAPVKAATTKAAESKGVLEYVIPGLFSNMSERPETSLQEAYFDLALCLKAQGRLRDALTALVNAESAADGRADIQLLKAGLLDSLGETQQAIITLEILKKDQPEMAEIYKRLGSLYEKNKQPELAKKAWADASALNFDDLELQRHALDESRKSKDKDISIEIPILERIVKNDADDMKSRLALAQAYENAGLKRQAAFTYQDIVTRNGDDMASRRKLGLLYATLPGFQGSAILQFKAVLEKSPNDLEVRRTLGELYLQSNNFEEAEKNLRWTLELDPKDALSMQNLGTLYAMQKRMEEALAAYHKALKLKPDMYDSQLNLARVLRDIDRKDESARELESYLQARPKDLEARRLYAELLRDLNRREEAVKQYEMIARDNPNDPQTIIELAKLSTLLGKYKEAAGMFETLLEKNPSNVDALRAAGRLYDDMKQPIRSMYCWQRMVRLLPNDPEGQSRLAAVYRNTGDDKGALERYEALGKSGDPEAWRNVAYLQLKRGEKVKASDAYRKAIELNKADVESRVALAGILQKSGKPDDQEEAIRLYRDILEIKADDNAARLNLANLYSERNRWPDAEEQYQEVLKRDKQSATAQVGLGVLQRKRGRFPRAEENYLAALQLDPHFKMAHYNLALLYDFYLNQPEKAKEHYDTFVKEGGDPNMLPGALAAQEVKVPEPVAPPKPGQKNDIKFVAPVPPLPDVPVPTSTDSSNNGPRPSKPPREAEPVPPPLPQ